MAEMTLEQQRAMALARARRARNSSATGEQTVTSAAGNLGAGVLEGTVGSITAPRDLGMLAGTGITYGIDRLRGLTPEQASAEQQRVRDMSQTYENSMVIPSPLSLVQQGFDKYIRPNLPEAKTGVDKTLRTIGQFAPAALSPGSAFQRTANVVVPALASEGAGRLTEGTSLEPFARIAGAMVGGKLAAPKTTAVKEAAKLAPTKAELSTEVKKAYKAIDDAGIVYDPDIFRQRITKLGDDLLKKDLDINAENVFRVVKRMESTDPARLTPNYLTEKFSELGDILGEANASGKQKMAASMARDAIFDIIGSTPAVSTKGLTGPEVAYMNQKARELASAQIKSRGIERNIKKAETYQSGETSGLRNQFSSLRRRLEDKNNSGWSKTELEALQTASKGNSVTNILNTLGRFGFDFGQKGNISALLPFGAAATTAGFLGGGILPAALTGAFGSASKYGARKMTERQAQDLLKTIMAGKQGQAKGRVISQLKNNKAAARRAMSTYSGIVSGLLNEDEGRR